MLKGIPEILQPDMLKVLAETGHGDKIVISDGKFPSARRARRRHDTVHRTLRLLRESQEVIRHNRNK